MTDPDKAPNPETSKQRVDRRNKDIGNIFLHRLDELWPKPRFCPICRNSNWNLDALAQLPMWEAPASGAVYPFFPIYCVTCGYTILMNPVVIGLSPASAKNPPDPGK
jgi:predicted nucleic-acid-binding Zn-ribbon protein